MKSVLGLLGVSALVLSCSSNGDVSFKDPPDGKGGTGTAGSDSGAGTKNDGGAKTDGGSGNVAGKNSGGTGGNGSAGTQNTAGTQGDGGGGTGNQDPEVIYVATSGSDDGDCGLTSDTACKSISQGSARAVEAQRDAVYVQAGSYAGVAVLKPGVNVIGGFDSAWQPGDRTEEAHQVTLEGGQEEASKEYVAVWAHDLDVQASLENLIIIGPDAVGQKEGTSTGLSSYGIHAVSAKLALKDVDIIAGAGASGASGVSGASAPQLSATAAMNGKVGGAGTMQKLECDDETASAGGEPGINACAGGPSAALTSGGRGGNGGTRDTNCSGGGPANPNYNARAGEAGSDAAVVSGQAGKGGSAGSGGRWGVISACGATTGGNNGVFANGSGGNAAGAGKLAADFWYASKGGDGGTGQNGSGGGGGGGSGSCDTNFNGTLDVRGAAGGGGGAGGCAALGGGGGGGGGGGSFGIVVVDSTIDVDGVSVTRGHGGDGGDGGDGGQGQSGGAGQLGGAAVAPGAAAGKGGNGAHGGHGGGGAGGNGGHSAAVLLGAGGVLNGMVTATGGGAGNGGAGGASAPNAADAERDGNDGQMGNDGAVDDSLDCSGGTC